MARSIQEISAKFKPLWEDDRLFYGVLVILVAIVSFGLGRLSISQNSQAFQEKAPIVLFEGASAPIAPSSSVPEVHEPQVAGAAAGTYVGSRNGSKYHLPWCPGASQIKDSNKVFFASKEEAEKAGYTPASNCKGI